MTKTIKTSTNVAISATLLPSSKSSRTVPIAGTLQAVQGYPDKLKIYQIAASRFWQVRCFESSTGKTIKRSTGQTDKREAIKFAKTLYDQLVFNRLNGVAMTKNSRFDVCAKGMMEMQAARVVRNDISAAAHRNDHYFLNAKILPEMRELDVNEITFDTLERFVGKIGADLSASSIQRHLGLIRKVLDYALNRNLLQAIPKFPKIRKQDAPRGSFSPAEYERLLTRAKAMVGNEHVIRANAKPGQKQGNVVRRLKITADLPHMIEFIANSFIRPTDLRNMQHKHVEIIRQEHTYLRLTLPESKKHDKPIVTMERAVDVYNDLKAHHAKSGLVGPTNYVFMPEYENRSTALRRLQQQFNHLLEELDMKHGSLGEERAIYSLRHTCIMFRLRDGDKIDLLTIARNARTSVAMIDRFYASQLTGEMNIDSIQSVRREKNKLALSSSPNTPLKVKSGVMSVDIPTNSSARLDLD